MIESDDLLVVTVVERDPSVVTVSEPGFVVIEQPVQVQTGGDEPERVVVTTNGVERVVLEEPQTVVLTLGQQGPPGTAKAAVFIQDVSGLGGIVGQKTWADTVPPQADILTATSDTDTVRAWVAAAGGKDYSPTVSVNGVPVSLSESGTKRWFTGYADITLLPGDNTITATTDEGGTDTVIVTLAGPGPEVLDVQFGPYPGAQTELKAGDTISVSITTEPEAIELTILAAGATISPSTLPVSGGTASGVITIGSGTGSLPIEVRAKNDLGTYGDKFTSSPLVLNQQHPEIGLISVTYPGLQGAFNAGESGTISALVSFFDEVSFSSPDLEIDDPYSALVPKTVTNTRTGYVGSGNNITVTANRHANNATTVRQGLARIATVPPKATISIVGSPARLVSSPTGQDYEVRISPDQLLSTVPSLDASHGTWVGAWTLSGTYYKRTLRISDSTPRGVGTFSNLQVTGLSGIVGTEIVAGSSYVVGGMTTRNITFPAFARVAPLGAAVGLPAKTSAQVSGGNVLVLKYDNTVAQNSYYIANADGSYNAQGEYLGLSDTAFAGSNTTGSLVVVFGEVA